ncbi:MAG: hydrogenase maturation protease [Caldiserica bacterium]|jgi:hydrogenase maturation protease|nr:hydrogenase maturation protease [Caldisericota bacterium]
MPLQKKPERKIKKSKFSPSSIEDFFKKRPLVILGAGSTLRGDDGWAFYLLSALKKSIPEGVHLFWGESAPESFLSPILRLNPEAVLICDAGDIPGSSGNWEFFDPEELPDEPLFSHRFPLKLLAEEVKKGSSAQVKFLLLKPAGIEFSLELSPQVRRAIPKIVSFLREILLQK